MRFGRKCDSDSIAGANDTTLDDDGHYASLAIESAVGGAFEDSGRETGLKLIELNARVTQAGDSYHCRLSQSKLGTCGEFKKLNALGGDVLAKITCGDREPL